MPTCDATMGSDLLKDLLAGWDALRTKGAHQAHLTGGGAVELLEARLAAHYGMKHALAVASGSAGLLAVALAIGLKRADFVTAAYGYGATIGGWLLLGNRPRFGDIDPDTLTLDPASAADLVGRRTRAILAADVFGHPSDDQRLRALADEHGLWYVADAAQSLGARREARPASALADVIVLSFTVGKTVDVGEGGAILTNSGDVYERLLWLTQHPYRQRRELGLEVFNEVGINARIHPIAAALAERSFEPALAAVRARQEACFRVIEILNGSGLTEPIRFAETGVEPAFFRLTAAWRSEERDRERTLLAALGAAEYEATIEPAPGTVLYWLPALVGHGRRNDRHTCPEAERQARVRFTVRLKLCPG